jgi:5-(carboxyamino)imidazole ribonucleotide synthase
MKRIGIIGGGQLAGMMAEAAQALGIKVLIQTPRSTDTAVRLATETILAAVDDAAATERLAQKCDAIVFENEFVDLPALEQLAAQGVKFYPPLTAIAPLLDKYTQRQYLQSIGLPVPQFTEFTPAVLTEERAFPVVVKARRHGYDGQGTFIIRDRQALESVWAEYGHLALLIEEFVPFERELAVIAARSEDGAIVIYPVVETQQEEQVCRRIYTPVLLPPSTMAEIDRIARTVMDKLQVVGVFGIELFLTQDQKVLINEIAPRVHNSGHHTIEACVTSQFSQAMRVAVGLPLGNTALLCGGAVMVNLLGYEESEDQYLEQRARISAIPCAHLHWYRKTESRPGRKLGHVTVTLDRFDRDRAAEIVDRIEGIWYRTQ